MDAAYGANYRQLYKTHWWWRARERILRRTLKSLPLPAGAEILDFGCGDALSFAMLGDFGNVRGIEVDVNLIDPANPDRALISTEPLGSAEYRASKFDLITAFDVIEHINDHSEAVRRLVDMLKPGGLLLITVPAFMSLWDQHDVVNRHFRRYRRSELQSIVPPAAHLVDSRYIFHWLFPMKWLLARLNQNRANAVAQHHIPIAPVNWLLERICAAEFVLFRWARLPFGTSVLALIQRAER